jgi:hypothetical protein
MGANALVWAAFGHVLKPKPNAAEAAIELRKWLLQ